MIENNWHIVDKYAKLIWDYMQLKHTLKPVDAIFVLGSNDTRVALHAADLFKQGYSDLIIFSGGNGKASQLNEPEAEIFASLAVKAGIPEGKILKEPNSTNTGENVTFVQQLLKEKEIKVASIIAVQKPYMERRTYATIKKQWPEIDVRVSSPKMTYEEYWGGDFDFKKRFINVMVGDLLRIKEYPAKGYPIEQIIPNDVWGAGQELISLGFNTYTL